MFTIIVVLFVSFSKCVAIYLPFGYFLYVDARTCVAFLGLGGVVLLLLVLVGQALGQFPEFLGAQTEIGVVVCAVVEDLVVQFVGLGVVEDDQTLVVLRALVHDLAKSLEGGEHARVVFVDTLAVGNVVLSKNEHIIDVGAQGGRNAERVLHGDDQHDLPVTAVHEKQAHQLVARPGVVVETIVQDDKGARVDGRAVVHGLLLLDLL